MRIARCFCFLSVVPFLLCLRSLAADWPPINPEELKITEEPLAPGAPAIYLYRQVDRDDSQGREYNYVRIKILKEEGREHANVELEYVKNLSSVRDIRARTIQPDGRIIDFQGQPFDKTVVKAKGVRFLAKTFTMPDVRVGSIIEYSYVYDRGSLGCYLVFDSQWILSEDIFTKRAKFSLSPNRCFAMRWTWRDLPTGTSPPVSDKGVIRLEAQNIPPFKIEDYMPPQNELKARVDFIYSNDEEKDPTKYWKQVDKTLYESVENFTWKRKAMEQAAAQIVGPADVPEVKLKKLYDRVQQVRNLSFEEQKTAQEEKREKLKEIRNVEDVWKRGYGDGGDITWLYLALVRAAGFDAHPVFVSRRDKFFFSPQLPDRSRLNDTVVLVKMNGKDLYFDPGTAFTPFGLLPWPETGVPGLKLDKDGGTWVRTTLPESSASQISRNATLNLSETGDLSGKLTITFTGLEAMSRRMEERNEDEANRRKFLEDEAKEFVPAAIEVELTNKPEWSSSASSLIAEYKLKLPGWVSGAGRRALLPVGIFSATEKNVFDHTERVHPIYFEFPSEKVDDVSISLPIGWQVSSLPAPQDKDSKVIHYVLKADNDKSTVHLKRQFSVDLLLLDPKYYPALRNFFQLVRTGDEEQVVLQPIGARASN